MRQVVNVRVAIRMTIALALGPTPIVWAQIAGVQIETARNTPKEQSESARLQGLLGRFDL